MISKAAVSVLLTDTNEKIIIPCHRHPDAYYILYKLHIKYKPIEEGFLDEMDVFHNRADSYQIAKNCGQIKDKTESILLYTEDIW